MSEVAGPPPARRPWVLVTDDAGGQSRSALAAVRALGAGGCRVAVSVAGPRSIAAASRHCRAVVPVPPAGSETYAPALRTELASRGVLAVFPSSDASLVALGAPAADLVDKSALASCARAAGIPTVESEVFADGPALLAAARRLPYPVVVKAGLKNSAAVRPAERVDDRAGLSPWAAVTGELVVQPFVATALRAVSGVSWAGALRAVVHQRYVRTWPPSCGVAAAAVTTQPDRPVEERLECLLRRHDGVFQAQFLGDRLIDVNPRVYGSLPLAVAAGANLPLVAVKAATGVFSPLVRGRPGVRYRWLEGDLRNLAESVLRRRISVWAAGWQALPRAGTAYSMESLSDPRPALERIRHVVRQVRA